MHTEQLADGGTSAIDKTSLPTLYADKSFWGMTVTQLFGAFNDNLFKQMILLVAVGLAAAAPQGSVNPQGIAQLVFALPFVLFSLFAGYVADRVSKRRIIVLAKVGEAVVMGLGLAAFYFYPTTGYAGVCVVLFLMGTQSAFFGPAKYGILPEMLRGTDLPRANGFFLMTTFLAIIFGMATAGWLSEALVGPPEVFEASPRRAAVDLWMASGLCVLIALIGTASSLLVRNVPPGNPGLRFRLSMLAIPADMRAFLAQDRLLLVTLLASSMFWLIGGVVQPTVNEFGINQLGLTQTPTSYMAASMGFGIAIGCCTAGYLSRDQVRFGLARVGAWGMFACLAALGLPSETTPHGHLWGYWGSYPWLIGLGAFAGFFVVPLQVFIQSRPPETLKGRMIAVMNLCSWIGIVISALLVIAIDAIQQAMGWQKATTFYFVAALMLPIALFYRPKDEALAVDEAAH